MHAWVVAATELAEDRVIWARGDKPQRPRPFVWLTLGMPVTDTRHLRFRRLQNSSERITVTSAAESDYVANLFEDPHSEDFDPYTYSAGAGETVEQIRDGWLALIDAGSSITVVAEGTDSILITGTDISPHFHLQVEGLATRTVVAEAICDTTYMQGRISVRIQAEASDVTGDEHAADLITRCLLGVGESTISAGLRAVGLAYESSSPPVDLSGLASVRSVSRAAQDHVFRIALQSTADVPWLRIASATGTITAQE